LSDKISDYSLWQRNWLPLRNKNAVFISDNYSYFDPKNYGDIFTSYRQTSNFPIYRNDNIIRIFFITECRSFKPAKLDDSYISEKQIGLKKNLFNELIRYDHETFKFINYRWHNIVFNYLVIPFSYLDHKGINLFFFIILILSIALLWNYKKEQFWHYLALFVAALILSTIINLILKDYFQRQRPISVFGEESVNFFYEVLRARSFPSGHTQVAFVMSVFIYVVNVRYRWILIALAFITGLERIYVGVHFPIDVFFGAVLGSSSAFLIIKLSEKLSNKNKH
jgi:undecaprenyl-diphosphatase